MEIKKCIKTSFSVIGKEGSTDDGNNFVKNLWENANNHFDEIEFLAKKDEEGNISGIWGLMSDFSRNFKPWEENFTRGLYLAGVEVMDDVEVPDTWIKWTVPAFEYLYIKVDNKYEEAFSYVLNYMDNNNIKLEGAVFDYNCPKENGQLYLFFPMRRL
ncbi:GyrI-like domain-containing protein [Clostridium brassicae]|uniref:GyrI-like domain-containing protein n=1 Tax=Clostridium brassicae TaxID=2999072 RepID=A0ABT4DG64_9CLOT|nr:GyrI-like domain-containing protein [Clostridium brassicae]MCY6960106.1 GyrI-like domain-containing protein [Clostridium brassicae]